MTKIKNNKWEVIIDTLTLCFVVLLGIFGNWIWAIVFFFLWVFFGHYKVLNDKVNFLIKKDRLNNKEYQEFLKRKI